MDYRPATTEESGSGANAANICPVSVIHQGSAVLGSAPFISWVLSLCSVTVPKGSLILPMLSCFVCSSLFLFTPLCSEGTTEACSYTLMTGNNTKERSHSPWVKRQVNVPRGIANVLVRLLLSSFVGTTCPFQESRLSSQPESLLPHSIWPPDEQITLRKTASVE